MKNVMIDLETVDNKTTSAILSIGAVFFDPRADALKPTQADMFYIVVDHKSGLDIGLTQSEDTMKWWDGQSEEARKVFTEPSVSTQDALKAFNEWLLERVSKKYLTPWGNGADFDNAILQHAYVKAGIECPWMFWNNKCYRTMKAVAKELGFEETKRQGTHHNALDDAIHQARNLQLIYSYLELI